LRRFSNAVHISKRAGPTLFTHNRSTYAASYVHRI